MNNYKDWIVEDIDNVYAHANLLNFPKLKAIIIKENGYVNISKFCEDAGKNFGHFVFEYTQNPNPHVCLPDNIINISTGDDFIKGIYIGPLYAMFVAVWCYPSVAKKMIKYIDEISN